MGLEGPTRVFNQQELWAGLNLMVPPITKVVILQQNVLIVLISVILLIRAAESTRQSHPIICPAHPDWFTCTSHDQLDHSTR